MYKFFAVWAGGLLTLLGASLWYVFTPGSVPEGQSPLVSLGAGSVGPFQTDFNRAADRIRVVAVLSPTRPAALAGATALQLLLMEFADLPILVQVVWEPQEESDWAPPPTEVLARLQDKRVKQYWDKSRRVSAVLGTGQVQVFSRGAAWREALPAPALAAESASAAAGTLRTFLQSVTPPAESDRPQVAGNAARAI
ncbi:MAG: hypothetical protein NTX13_09155 [Acidobacteria bacterium]|nr:hypothetical protein [Acidobacteriota bacterium]